MPEMRALTLALMLLAAPAWAQSPPVREIAPYRQAVPGGGLLALYATKDWAAVQAGITRVVVLVHGLSRDADAYFATAQQAQAAAGPAGVGAMMLAPHFLTQADVAAHHGDPALLRWEWDKWASGGASVEPVQISAFAAMDALLLALADRVRFPDLRTVVLAGHSAGAQVVHRHIVVSEAETKLAAAGIGLLHVVANPSAYVWFSGDRPQPTGGFGPWEGAASCPGYAAWRYGLPGAPDNIRATPAEVEARYVGRAVTYLLGTLDVDPNHRVLDKSCEARSQGPSRFARGHAYFAHLRARHPDLQHRLFDVPGVGHEGGKMFNSTCGLAALFETPGCE
jgi:hypothetical protein